MAVRVKVDPVKYEVSCDCCKAVLEYIGSDVQREEREYQRRSETYKYIVCPVCNNKVYIQSGKTASEVLEGVVNKSKMEDNMVKIFKKSSDGTEEFYCECKKSELEDELQSLHDIFMDKPFWFITK